MLLVYHDTCKCICDVTPGIFIIDHFADILNTAHGTSVDIQREQLIPLTIAGKEHVDKVGLGVIGHGHQIAVGGAVNTLVLERSDICNCTGFGVKHTDPVHEGGVNENLALICDFQHMDTSLGSSLAADDAQLAQFTGLHIHLIQTAAGIVFEVLLVSISICVGVGCIHTVGAHSQQTVVGLVPSHVANHEVRHVSSGSIGIAFFIRLIQFNATVTNIGTLEILVGTGVEQVIILVVGKDNTIDRRQSGDSRSILTLGEVDNHSGIGTIDGREAAISQIIGDKVALFTVNDDLAGCAHAIFCGNGDGGRTCRYTGHDTVLIHSRHGLIVGFPGHLHLGGGRQDKGFQCHGITFADFLKSGGDQQLAQFRGDFRILLGKGDQTGDLRSGCTNSAQSVDSLLFQVDELQAALIHGVQGHPVDVAGVIVIGHGADLIADNAGIQEQLAGTVFDIHGVHHGVGVGGHPGHGIEVLNAALNDVNSAVCVNSQVQEHLFIKQDAFDQLTVCQIDIVQVGRSLRTSHCQHSAGGVVKGHVVDEGELIAHVNAVNDLPSLGVDGEELEVCRPILVIEAIGIDVAIDILSSIQRHVSAVILHIRHRHIILGVGIGHFEPEVAVVSSNILHHVSIQAAGGLLDSNIEFHNELVVIKVNDGCSDGSIAKASADHHAVFVHISDLGVGGLPGGNGLDGSIEGVDVHCSRLRAAQQDHHIFCHHIGDVRRLQLGDLLGHHEGTSVLD